MLGAIVTGCGDGTRAGAPPPPPVVTVEAVVQRDVPISAEWVGSLVGYITAENLSELIMIQSSRASGPAAPQRQPTESAS